MHRIDSLTLYRTILELIVNSRVHFHDRRCPVTFLWAIVGVLNEKYVHMSRWGNHRPGAVQAASKERQFTRWLDNAKIQEAAIYKKLAQTALVRRKKAGWLAVVWWKVVASNSRHASVGRGCVGAEGAGHLLPMRNATLSKRFDQRRESVYYSPNI